MLSGETASGKYPVAAVKNMVETIAFTESSISYENRFKKAEFAKLVRENISEDTDISEEIFEIVKEIFCQNKSLDTKICS